jgi:YidC/Oxa1 family membrane protein insertase
MIEVYRRHKVNPLGGCLPMLLQLPVFIRSCYNALAARPIELRPRVPFIALDSRSFANPIGLGRWPIPFRLSPPGSPVLTSADDEAVSMLGLQHE